jgi:hypothetical protein
VKKEVAVLLILIEGSNSTVPHSISGFIYFGFDIRFYKDEKRSINAIKTIYNSRKDVRKDVKYF